MEENTAFGKNTSKCGDPIGQAIYDHYFGQSPEAVVIYSDIGDKETMKPEYFFRQAWFMPPVEKFALKRCKGKVLDIGAGAGCHAVTLTESGYEVHTLESSALAVEVLNARGLHPVYHSDIYRFEEPVKFDTLLLLMNGIGLCGTIDGLRRFLELARNMLKPGGRILTDSSDIHFLLGDEGIDKRINEFQRYYGIVEYRLEYKQITGDPFNWLYIDFDSLKQVADEKGWQAEKLYEGKLFHYLVSLTPQ